ncbi:pyridoxamine 5'-phosphate oxidase family protein [Mycobacterium sp. CBMA271]|uniref:pyridoxamine 5'-phosphate oxidase family protein n=1 Tax=unclassified Mycobacteroides TaxID=2618759 RepID=UPI0012DC3F50|nr:MULTISPECIES: pyridoxamine 5'-phosphate oxidase family protein [unclassified Mycobacteroides]MUM18792.1 hypothetical protein [Mycobacteroides sp. CBMA 326]MUM22755.1 pyridoxamine 5'-phosphate oxidase family protein [Mycobacteroides sp. CBMA 271]
MTGYSRIAYTPGVVAQQMLHGSEKAIARSAQGDRFEGLSDAERRFISLRDEFYIASVGETGWPYIQYKSGLEGFVSVGESGMTLSYREIAGNRQYISFGNIKANPRVSLFFIDYVGRMRLKIFGVARLHQNEMSEKVETRVEISVEASDWNCPKSIIQRFGLDQVAAIIDGR